jgi:hypothetical protein
LVRLVAACVCVFALVATSGASAASKPKPNLIITVTSLPSGARPTITVTGPSPKKTIRTLHASAKLHLKHGSYSLKADRVLVNGSWYTPSVQTRTVAVHAVQATTVTIAYSTVVPATTKPLGSQALGALKSISSNQSVLTFKGAGAPTTLAAGDVIAAGVSDATPDGLLRMVTSVSQGASGTVIVDTKPATLDQAIASGSFVVSSDSASQTSSTSALQSHASKPLKQRIDRSLSCGAGASISLTGSVTLQPRWKVSVHLGGSPSAKFTASFTESASLAAAAEANANCSLSPVPLLPHPLHLPTIAVFVGFVPVVVEPEVQFYLTASGSVTAALSTSVTQTFTASAGVDYQNGGYHPFSTVKNSFTFVPPAPPTVTADAKAAVGPELDLLFYGVGGPELDAQASLDLSVDTTKTPWWTLSGGLNIGGGLTVPALDLKYSNDAIFKVSKVIAQAPTGSGGGDLIFNYSLRTGPPGIYTAKPDGTQISAVPGTGSDTPNGEGDEDNFPSWTGNQSQFTFERDYHVAPDEAENELRLSNADGSAQRVLLSSSANPTVSFGAFEISPDGQWISFSAYNQFNNAELWVERTDGSGLQAIRPNTCSEQNLNTTGPQEATFTPDSKQIAFAYSCVGDGGESLGVENLDGTGFQTIVPPSPTNFGDLTLSPDGSTLMFMDDSSAIATIPITGGIPTVIFDSPTGNPIVYPRFSPSGGEIAFIETDPNCGFQTVAGAVVVATSTGQDPTTVIAANACVENLDW